MVPEHQTITNLHDLLKHDVCRFTAAEVLLKDNLPEWINRAGSLQLKTVLQKYLDFVILHIQKAEEFLRKEQVTFPGTGNRVMQAFVEETGEILNACTDGEVRDACLLASIQEINHFKISVYGTAAAFANTLEMPGYAALFHEAEVNEKQIDDRLSQLAEFEINRRAKTPIVLPG